MTKCITKLKMVNTTLTHHKQESLDKSKDKDGGQEDSGSSPRELKGAVCS